MLKFAAYSLLFTVVVASAPNIARAEGFGTAGTVVPSGGISLSHSHIAGGDGSFLFLNVAPELSYFVVENWALGGGVSFGLDAGPGFMTTSWGGRLTTGYYFPISDSIGVFPRTGVSYTRWTLTSGPGAAVGLLGGASYSQEHVTVDVGAPVLFSTDHFFIGFGPELYKIVVGVPDAPYVIALSTTIGGWF